MIIETTSVLREVEDFSYISTLRHYEPFTVEEQTLPSQVPQANVAK